MRKAQATLFSLIGFFADKTLNALTLAYFVD
jgi:hypothetical protein